MKTIQNRAKGTISFVNYASSIALIWLVTPSCPNCQCVVIICLELAINIDQPLLPALHLSNIFFFFYYFCLTLK